MKFFLATSVSQNCGRAKMGVPSLSRQGEFHRSIHQMTVSVDAEAEAVMPACYQESKQEVGRLESLIGPSGQGDKSGGLSPHLRGPQSRSEAGCLGALHTGAQPG